MKITDLDRNYITESRIDELEAWDKFKQTFVGGAIARGLERGAAKGLAKVNNRAAGIQQTQVVVKSMFQGYQKWLGRQGGKPTVGTLAKYMTELGFKPQDIKMALEPMVTENDWSSGVTDASVNYQGHQDQGQQQNPPQDQQPEPAQDPGLTQNTSPLTRSKVFTAMEKALQSAAQGKRIPPPLKKMYKASV